ncbi:HPF/RaiA family ribosome-associated protein [Sphingomonas glaciei]|uniref:HPF/RaiA family ribosome-associated protein n=1 Tax=Sphingomonas glaciei TaxID=2938948 RepID=A0ABY5MYU8_9SPHN|nr:HPF/RaiA family ribosome-associated protein [Sphingomonas glaciei]UUR09194.1 hypothetical protein M1K48_06170 [Sphingomonas glaciei]
MFIDFNRDNQVQDNEASQEQVESIVNHRLSRLDGKVTSAQVHLAHVRETKSSNPDYRCSIEIRPENLSPVAASAEGAGVDAVVRAACDKVLHAYDKVVGKQGAR